MKHLELHCRACSDRVVLDPETVILHHTPDLSSGVYAFQCPSCGESARRVATGSGIRFLRSAGVTSDTHPGGPPLTVDDLLDLINDLKHL